MADGMVTWTRTGFKGEALSQRDIDDWNRRMAEDGWLLVKQSPPEEISDKQYKIEFVYKRPDS
jgi:hypothetical protein